MVVGMSAATAAMAAGSTPAASAAVCYQSNYRTVSYALNLRIGTRRTTCSRLPHVRVDDAQIASLRSRITQLKAMS
jgi:hypothetical protein